MLWFCPKMEDGLPVIFFGKMVEEIAIFGVAILLNSDDANSEDRQLLTP